MLVELRQAGSEALLDRLELDDPPPSWALAGMQRQKLSGDAAPPPLHAQKRAVSNRFGGIVSQTSKAAFRCQTLASWLGDR